jgi:apolipoprotein N-acyltransferase
MARLHRETVTGATTESGGIAASCTAWWLRRHRWVRRLVLMALGAIAALAFAPVNALPAFAIGIVGLIWLAQTRTTWRGRFALGWWWSFGHFLAGFFWIANSFLIDPVRFGWMVPPVIAGLAAYMALYPALAVGMALRARWPLLAQVFLFAAAWVVAEWLRGHVMTGFPWNLSAYVWSPSVPMIQTASLWGAWGLSLITLLMAGLIALMGHGRRRTDLSAGLAFLVLLAALYGYGAWRTGTAAEGNTGKLLRLVQGNISQVEKLTGANRDQHVAQHLRLSVTRSGLDKVAAVIWPETAATFFLDRSPEWRAYIAGAAPPDGVLITGALRGAPEQGDIEQYWNSLAVLDPAGQIIGTADKFHLVPLGEYVPLYDVLGGLIGKLTSGAGNFSAGPGPTTVHVNGVPPFSPLICYEVIFPGAVLDAADRPAWLLNVTNDGWFGNSPGPYQHLVSARFRAVEEGLPLARAANTGISAMIDPYGRIIESLPLGTEGTLDAFLPNALDLTLFARIGLAAPTGLIVLMLICALVATRFTELRNR